MKKIILSILLGIGLCLSAQAITNTAVNATTNWSATGAWQGGANIPNGPGDVANLYRSIGVNNKTTTLDISVTLGGLSVGAADAANGKIVTITPTNSSTITFTNIGGGSAYILKGANTFTNPTDVINAPLILGVNLDVTNASTYGGLNIAGNISEVGSRTVSINNSFTGNLGVTLSGTNTYSGGTILNSGKLNIGNSSSLGTGTLTLNGGVLSGLSTFTNANNINLSSDSTIGAVSGTTMTLVGAITNSGNLIINDQGTVVLNGTNSYGATVINSGTLQISAKTGSGTLGAGNVTNNGVLAFNRTAALTVANNISGTGSVQTVGSSSALITLSGTNTYSGETRATSGVGSGFAVTSDSNLGTGTNIYIGQNARLQVNGDMATSKNIQMTGANPMLDIAADKTLTLNGTIYGTSGSPRKDVGTGTLILNGANQFADKSVFLIQTGTLKLGNAAALNGTTLKFNGVTTLDNVTGTDNLAPTGLQGLELTTGFTYTGTKSLDLSGVSAGFVQTNTVKNINVVANRLTIGGIRATGTNYAGTALLDGSLTKSGLGTLEIKGDSDFTNATLITAGALIVNGSLASKQVTVNTGGTLGGTGAFQSVTVATGGVLSAGNSPGMMTFANALTLSAGSTNIMEILSASAYDILMGSLTNSLTASGAAFVFNFTSNSISSTTTFNVLQNWSSINTNGATFSVIGLGVNQSLDYSNLGAGSVTLNVIPEPATFLLFGVGGMGAWLIRRNRMKVSEDEDESDA